MGIRLSGLASGMDTEALVSALVSSYSLQKDNLVKAQTKHSWKQDSWKAMNKSIYSFYSGKLSAARLSQTYSLKMASISNSVYAKVTASQSAVNGTQTLEVKKLASTGYLTGGVVKGKDENGNDVKVTGSSKLSTMFGSAADGASITVSTGGSQKTIELTSDMTVNQFVAKLSESGLNANFDETNQRFFISSKESGASNDFSITAGNAQGLEALKGMGLLTALDKDSEEYKEYQKWASYASDPDALEKEIEKAYKDIEINIADRAKVYAEKYNNAKAAMDKIASDNTVQKDPNLTVEENIQKAIDDGKAEIANEFAAYAVTDSEGNVTYDTSKMSEEELASYNKKTKAVTDYENQKKLYQDNKSVLDDMSKYVTITDAGKAVAPADGSAEYNALKAKVHAENADNRANIADKFAKKAQYISANFDTLTNSSSYGAVRIAGADAQIVLNGAVFNSNTNNFSINGLTIQATAVTGNEKVSITTGTDVDAIYDTIKDFIKEYNTLITAIDTAYNAPSAKGYEPLTSEEKEAMSDDEVEKWEKKIKDSILRKDSILGNTSTAMKNAMSMSIEIEGKKYSLASFGIKTQNYFESGTNEKGVLHIDGDKDDSVSAGQDDALREAIANDPELVMEFFSKLSTNLYNDLTKRMASTSMSSMYTIYNDKEMAIEYSEYNTKISDKEDEIAKWEDYYYKKFSRMESAMAALNSQQSSLSGLFGSL